MKDYIGRYVKQFESGNKGSLCLAQCGYDYGLSCGSYQLTLRWGNCISFLKRYFPEVATDLYFNNLPDIKSAKYPEPDIVQVQNKLKRCGCFVMSLSVKKSSLSMNMTSFGNSIMNR